MAESPKGIYFLSEWSEWRTLVIDVIGWAEPVQFIVELTIVRQSCHWTLLLITYGEKYDDPRLT